MFVDLLLIVSFVHPDGQKAYFKERLKMRQSDVVEAGKVFAKMVQPLQTIPSVEALSPVKSNPKKAHKHIEKTKLGSAIPKGFGNS